MWVHRAMLIPEFDAGNGIVLPPVQVCDEDAFRLYEVLTHPKKLAKTLWNWGFLCTSIRQLGFWFRDTEGFGYALLKASDNYAVCLSEFASVAQPGLVIRRTPHPPPPLGHTTAPSTLLPLLEGVSHEL